MYRTARTAVPLFDQPDLKASRELALELPAGWAAIANAPRLSVTDLGARSLHQFAPFEPISTYFFGFVAGRFETVTQPLKGKSMTLMKILQALDMPERAMRLRQ